MNDRFDSQTPCAASAGALNKACFCISLDQAALRQALEAELGGLSQLVAERCPHMFAAQPVFMAGSHARMLENVVRAVESVAALPAYRSQVLADAPAIARHDPGGAQGVFFGYDFHVSERGIGLIEINTNAGGALLNAALARAQRACCATVENMFPLQGSAAELEDRIVAMFHAEWALSRRGHPLRSIAIVDQAPHQQYLYPEFQLFQQLFQRHGLHAVIADPAELDWRDGRLWHRDTAIDLVYNRLTDFMLEAPASAALRAAYLAHAVVLTPHPQAHALYANKRNLALLSDDARLQALGVAPDARAILRSAIPRTEAVTADHAQRLWQDRRHLFFKPAAGYGSRAAYRGDKLTRRVWEDILAGDYVAQQLITPGERVIDRHDAAQLLKFDVRAYAYAGTVQWVAARLYQGQTTNFRTPGGGFAPVYRVADAYPAGRKEDDHSCSQCFPALRL